MTALHPTSSAAPAYDDALGGGFADPVLDAQAVFRAVLAAMAEPARPVAVVPRAAGPVPLTRLVASVALTLADADTPVWLDAALAAEPSVARWFAFHTGAPIVADPADAAFAFIADPRRMPTLESFAKGSLEYPDRSTTLVIAVAGFDDAGPRFDGPGFESPRRFAPRPAFAEFARQVAANRALHPRGVDLLFCASDAVAALPRSSRLIAED